MIKDREKVAINVGKLNRYWKNIPSFSIPGRFKGIGGLIEPHKSINYMANMVGGGTIGLGKNKGMYFTPGGPLRSLSSMFIRSPKLIREMGMRVSPQLGSVEHIYRGISDSGKMALNKILKSHEAMEYYAANKILPSRTANMFANKDVLSMILSGNYKKSGGLFGLLPRRGLGKVVHGAGKHQFFGHMSPEVILRESNMLSTLSGQGSVEAKALMLKLRDMAGEARYLNDLARRRGFGFQFGKTHLNTKSREEFMRMIYKHMKRHPANRMSMGI